MRRSEDDYRRANDRLMADYLRDHNPRGGWRRSPPTQRSDMWLAALLCAAVAAMIMAQLMGSW